MPSIISYICAKCDLDGSTFSSWGMFRYKVGKKLIPLKRDTGICHACNTITPVEVLPNQDEIRNLVQQVESGKIHSDALDENSYRPYALKDRQAPARCLNCGAHDFDVLPTVEKDPERARSRTPIRTGLVHKNCGGRIYGDPFGPNFFMGDRLPKRVFSIEGIDITASN